MMDRILNVVGIGRAALIDDSGDVQLVQVTESAEGNGGTDLVTDKVPRIAEFGFASVPPLGAVVGLLRRSGERGRSLIFGTSHTPSRPKNLQPGDTVLYDVRGAKVQLTADGLLIDCAGLPAIVQNATTITLKASDKVTIDAPTVEALHDMTVGGSLAVTGDVTSAGGAAKLTELRDAFNGHQHGNIQRGTQVSDGPTPTV